MVSTGMVGLREASGGTHEPALKNYALNVNAEDNFALAA